PTPTGCARPTATSRRTARPRSCRPTGTQGRSMRCAPTWPRRSTTSRPNGSRRRPGASVGAATTSPPAPPASQRGPRQPSGDAPSSCMRDGLTQDQVALVLRRAADLDRHLGQTAPEPTLDPAAVEQAAIEAGISRAAVRRALAELHSGLLEAPA